jgi:VWFA-related protein
MLRRSLALILLAAVTLSSAQSLDEFKLRVDVELVQLPVSVLDKNGLPVRGLKQEYFSIFEDKVQQNITLFKQEDVPLSVAIVIDASGSMLDKLDRLNAAAMTFIRESNPADETSIVSFADEVYLEQDLTNNTQILGRVLSEIASTGSTAFYDAVYLAARHLQREAIHEKKVLLVLSDGEDNKSKYNLKQVLKLLGESRITLYSIGLLSYGASTYGLQGQTGKKALKQLSEVTGGVPFFPKSVKDVEEICAKIARDLRNQYTIGYRPSNTKLDGSWRKVVVQLKPPRHMPKLKVRTKQGYYAPLSGETRTASDKSGRQSRTEDAGLRRIQLK